MCSQYTPKDIARFWAKVDRSGGPDACWFWTGGRNQQGYGCFTLRGPQSGRCYAHRLADELAYGPIPAGACILHRCDTPACVNPAHLWRGTRSENAHDRTAKGRDARGERHGWALDPTRIPRGEATGHAKLTTEQVREIRRLYAAGGVRQRDLARRFGVSIPTISMVINRKVWQHVA